MKAIEVKDLSFKYNQDSEFVLNHLTFTINSGQWVAIVGHNGSGKSTLTKNLNGLLIPSGGEIYIEGQLLSDETVWEIRKNIGIVFQNPDNQFVGATVADDVAFGLENRAVPTPKMHKRVEHALKAVDMWDYAAKEPARLSGGQKQRVALAGIIAIQPDIVILDESTSMLDPEGRQEVLQIVTDLQKKQHKTVLSVTHDLEEAALADRIMVLDHGELVADGTPSEVFSQTQLLESVGLTLPFTTQLKRDLQQRQIKLSPGYSDNQALAEELWTLYSKM